MIVGGCDVGSLTSKAVVLKDGRMVGSAISKSKTRPWESAESVMKQALDACGLTMSDVCYFVGTGYGRDRITFINEAVSEITCHGKGARWLVPSVKTVIDIGGQDCKVMRLDKDGNIEKFIANDKCASGTGRFLEVMAKVLCVELEKLGELPAKSRSPVKLANACTVWAQADVIKHLNDGIPLEDISAGVNNAMASRISTLVNNLSRIEPDICMTGGVAKNNGVVNALEKLLDTRIKRIKRMDPQITGALGAALIAMEKSSGGRP